MLQVALDQKRWSLKQLQAIAGKLNWASMVVRGGRSYLRRLLDVMKPLKSNRHKVQASKGMKEDLRWWKDFLEVFNGKRVVRAFPMVHAASVDACTEGGGVAWGKSWHYVNWALDQPNLKDCHINIKETATILLALSKWALEWANCKVIIWSDNVTAVTCVNKGSSKCKVIMSLIRNIFWIKEILNIDLHCYYLPGKYNEVADTISRLHEFSSWDRLRSCFGIDRDVFRCCWPYFLALHTSYKSLLCLIPQAVKATASWGDSEQSLSSCKRVPLLLLQ